VIINIARLAVCLAALIASAACSGGAGSPTNVGQPMAAAAANGATVDGAARIAKVPAASSTSSPAPLPSGLQIGGVDGTTVVPKANGATWEFSEDLDVTFPAPLNQQVQVAISPSPVASPQVVYPLQAVPPTGSHTYTNLQVRWQKAPNTTYTVTISNAQPGWSPVHGNVVVRVVSPQSVPSPQAPVASRRADPYYYGSLEHSATYPYGLKLANSGSIDPRALNALTGQGVHFIRFGPTPNEVAQNRQSYSFASTDPTIATLHGNNIETLYVIDAAVPPTWGNTNAAHDARPIFETPALYAEYCGGVAAHIAQTFSTTTRVEIGTNEPNYSSNWTNGQARLDGMPQYADQTGTGIAPYLRSCYAAIKAVAPKIQVVAPGIAINPFAYPFLPFVDHLYAAGCRTGVCWDIFSVHSYTWSNPAYTYDQSFIDNLAGAGAGPGSFYSYRDVQARANGDGETGTLPIMITETGFSSNQHFVQGVDPSVQATYTSIAFNQYLQDPSIKGIVWTDVVNHETSQWIFNGIATYGDNMSTKPVFAVYKQFAAY